MDKLLNNLENKLKDVEQDIKILNSLNICKNDLCAIKRNKDTLDFKKEQKENLQDLIDSVEQLKRDLKNDNTLTNVFDSFKCFKESIEMNDEFNSNNVWLNYIPNQLKSITKG